MATGASNADLAVLLVDARKGLLTQTRRHAIIVAPARHPPRRAGGQQDRPRRLTTARCSSGIVAELRRASPPTLGFKDITGIPMSARHGDNVSSRSERTPWYAGPHLLRLSGNASTSRTAAPASRSACRCNGSTGRNLDFRGFAGTIAERQRQAGRRDRRCCRRARATRVKSITGRRRRDRRPRRPATPSRVTLARRDRRRARRHAGARRATARRSPTSSPRIWSGWRASRLLPGPLLSDEDQQHARSPRTVTELKHRIDVNTLPSSPPRR